VQRKLLTDVMVTFVDHLRELLRKLLLCFLAIALGALVAHYYHEQLIAFLLTPLHDRKLFFLSPLDPLFFVLKVDFLTGSLLALPVLSWSVLSFVKPAMKASSWFLFSLLYGIAAVSITVGLAYGYFIVLPRTLGFLLSIHVAGVDNMITANSYLGFLLVQALVISALFQIPLFILGGLHIHAFKITTLAAKRRSIYLIGLLALTFVSPPDLLSFGSLAIPACLLFEGSVLAARIINWSARRATTDRQEPIG
jgi:sec-independent protein translocase protein TatC